MALSTHERAASETFSTPVLVVGAGPVGSVLALGLARHRVPSILVEQSTSPSRYPKMDYINGRSMELLRRLGLAEDIRRHGVSPEHSSNFIWTRSFDEPPVAVWKYASVAEMQERIATVNDGSVGTEPYQRVQGSLLAEVVRRHARENPLLDVPEIRRGVHHRQGAEHRPLAGSAGRGRVLPEGLGIPRRRFGAPFLPDRGPRRQHRPRRRGGPRVEAGGLPQRLGRSRAAGQLRGRAAAGRAVQP